VVPRVKSFFAFFGKIWARVTAMQRALDLARVARSCRSPTEFRRSDEKFSTVWGVNEDSRRVAITTQEAGADQTFGGVTPIWP
jgi:hypothetical protein